MTSDNFCFYLQNRLIQTSQTGGQQYSDTVMTLVFHAQSYTVIAAKKFLQCMALLFFKHFGNFPSFPYS
jgi:hypothetical protein